MKNQKVKKGKKETASAAGAKKVRCQEKADILFILYQQMGPDRSLENLSGLCTKMGLAGASLNTLKRYSVMFDWQRRLIEETVRQREERERNNLQQIEDMNDQHIKVNKALMSLAVAGISNFQQEIERKKDAGLPSTLKISVQDIVRLVNQAQSGERLARGQATSRAEVMVEVIGTFVNEAALIFVSVNDIEDKDKRKAEYVRLFDAMLKTYYTRLTGPAIERIDITGH